MPGPWSDRTQQTATTTTIATLWVHNDSRPPKPVSTNRNSYYYSCRCRPDTDLTTYRKDRVEIHQNRTDQKTERETKTTDRDQASIILMDVSAWAAWY